MGVSVGFAFLQNFLFVLFVFGFTAHSYPFRMILFPLLDLGTNLFFVFLVIVGAPSYLGRVCMRSLVVLAHVVSVLLSFFLCSLRHVVDIYGEKNGIICTAEIQDEEMNTIYTTTQGDMWDSIAYSQYGDESLMQVLVESNAALNQIVVFDAGTKVTIPQVSATTALPAPPWKTITQLG